jgi:hypothetical protein
MGAPRTRRALAVSVPAFLAYLRLAIAYLYATLRG